MKINTALALGAALAVTGASSVASAQSATDVNQPQTTITTNQTSRVPHGADVRVTESSVPNRPLLVGSGFLGVAAYVPSAVAGAVSDRSEDRYLFIPVAGPWIDLANRDCNARPCGDEDLNKAFIIGSGVIQGVAALGVLSSFIIPERRTVLSTASNKKNNFFVAPASLGRSAYGMSAVGTF